MTISETPLKDCYIIEMPKFDDERGFFLESFNARKFADQGIDFEVKQINFSRSQKNVLRGLHYQTGEHAQSKLVGVIEGSVMDVAVDLRKNSPTYLNHFKLVIDRPELFLLVPKGFAHGYNSLQDNTTFYYAVNNFFAPGAEAGIKYNDPALAIDWEFVAEPIVSSKDLKHPALKV